MQRKNSVFIKSSFLYFLNTKLLLQAEGIDFSPSLWGHVASCSCLIAMKSTSPLSSSLFRNFQVSSHRENISPIRPDPLSPALFMLILLIKRRLHDCSLLQFEFLAREIRTSVPATWRCNLVKVKMMSLKRIALFRSRTRRRWSLAEDDEGSCSSGTMYVGNLRG